MNVDTFFASHSLLISSLFLLESMLQLLDIISFRRFVILHIQFARRCSGVARQDYDQRHVIDVVLKSFKRAPNMSEAENSSDSTMFISSDQKLSEKQKEKNMKKRNRDILTFSSPGPRQAQIDSIKRESKPPNFLLPEHTSKKTYRCASVSTIFRGATEVEFRATFLPAGEADRSGVEEEDYIQNSENVIEVEQEFVLDKDKCTCPVCRGRMDCDVEWIFIGKCAICFETDIQCSLICSSNNYEHGLCGECLEHYKQKIKGKQNDNY